MSADLYDDAYYAGMRGHAIGDGGGLYETFVSIAAEHLRSESRILDAGCGTGDLVIALMSAGWKNVWGIDFSEAAVRVARDAVEHATGAGADERIRWGSITDQALMPADAFDFVFMTDVVEHLPPPDLDLALRTIGHWIKPTGRLMIHTFPTRGPHIVYRTLLRMAGRRDDIRQLDAIHCNVQTRRSLTRTLGDAGWTIERLWLRNDFTLTSSAFQRMRDTLPRRSIGWFVEVALNWPPVQKTSTILGLSEFVAPSIYAICSRASR